MTSGTPAGRRRISRAVELGALLLLLGGHFLLRYGADRALPLAERSQAFHSRVYQVSLRLLASGEFTCPEIQDLPQAAPLRRFLEMKEPSLDRADLEAYFAAEAPPSCDWQPGEVSPLLEEARILDLRAAALLWGLFGIRWDVLFLFFTVLSTTACLLLVLATRRLFGPWTGLAAGALFALSPLERLYLLNPTYTTPLWFAAFGLCAVVYASEGLRHRALELAAAGAAGAVAALGLGWRPNVLLLLPFLALVLALRLATRRRPLGYTAAAVALFLLGAALCATGIRQLGGDRQLPQRTGFHVAFYGNAVRSNLMGIEDSLQIFRCDREVEHQARYRAGEAGRSLVYLGPAYGRTCQSMYLEAAAHDAWAWVRGFPGFYLRALRATALRDLGIPRNGELSIDAAPGPAAAPGWLTAALRAGGGAAPLLALLGIAAAALMIERWWLGLVIAAHSAYEAAVLLMLLPEYVHAATLVLPVTILAGLGAVAVARLPAELWQAGREDRPLVRPARLKRAGAAALVLLALWGLAALAARVYSSHRRAELIERIQAAAESAVPDPAVVLSDHLLSFTILPGERPDPVGYLVEIQGGERPVTLTVRHLRPHRAGSWNRRHETWHRIAPGRRQLLFLTALQGRRQRDRRPYRCTVILEEGAEIVAASRVDLADWRGPRVSSVFFPGQRSPGSPFLGGPSNTTWYNPRWEDPLGFSPAERVRFAGLWLERLRLDPRPGLPLLLFRPGAKDLRRGGELAAHLRPRGRAELEPTGSRSVRFRIPPGEHFLTTPLLQVEAGGWLELRARYRTASGGLRLLLRDRDGRVLGARRHAAARPSDAGWLQMLAVPLAPGAVLRLVVQADPALGGEPALGEIDDLAFLPSQPRPGRGPAGTAAGRSG